MMQREATINTPSRLNFNMAKTTKKKATKRSNDYTATLAIFGRTFTATGPTISEAITNIEPGVAKGRCFLTLSKGDKTK